MASSVFDMRSASQGFGSRCALVAQTQLEDAGGRLAPCWHTKRARGVSNSGLKRMAPVPQTKAFRKHTVPAVKPTNTSIANCIFLAEKVTFDRPTWIHGARILILWLGQTPMTPLLCLWSWDYCECGKTRQFSNCPITRDKAIKGQHVKKSLMCYISEAPLSLLWMWNNLPRHLLCVRGDIYCWPCQHTVIPVSNIAVWPVRPILGHHNFQCVCVFEKVRQGSQGENGAKERGGTGITSTLQQFHHMLLFFSHPMSSRTKHNLLIPVISYFWCREVCVKAKQ